MSKEAKKNDPFPWKKPLLVYFAVLSNMIPNLLINPFIPSMLKERYKISPDVLGVYTGILQSSFEITQLFGGFYLGHVSDLLGRKLLLVLSLFSSAVCIFLFGFAFSYTFSVVVQLVSGLINATSVLTDAIMGDLTQGENMVHRPRLFGFLGATTALGRGLGSLLTSLTWGKSLGSIDLRSNPYFLPCFVGSIIGLLGSVVVAIFYKETNKWRSIGFKKLLSSKNSNNGATHEESLLMTSTKTKIIWKRLKIGIKEILKDRTLIKLYFLYWANNFLNGWFFNAILLYGALNTKKNGLGFQPRTIGFVFVIFAFWALVYQLAFAKKAFKKIGVIRSYAFLGGIPISIGALLFASTVLYIPKFGDNYQKNFFTWLLLIVIFIPITVGFLSLLPNLNTLISTAAGKQRQGLILGSGSSIGSVFRSLGPLLGGSLFSAFQSFNFPQLVFILLAILYLLCALAAYLLRNSLSSIDNYKLISNNSNQNDDQSVLLNSDSERKTDSELHLDLQSETGSESGSGSKSKSKSESESDSESESKPEPEAELD
ncbi:protein zinc induced facilitator-like 1 [Anaeramoeba flamelloides]|uniref:Protein zinc induced facilitator-like 1 n=1 Tax=Anaeramoeba flamelloides TaxID=1746091 RepID=A0ABQ8XAT7_9EUKA|nr:protein zinc induced facilitator-like 1 [Anaeramoeba flamelloides]